MKAKGNPSQDKNNCISTSVNSKNNNSQ